MTDVFTLVVRDGDWDHSRFPHPLITIDYDAADNPIQIQAVGPIAASLTEAVSSVVAVLGRTQT